MNARGFSQVTILGSHVDLPTVDETLSRMEAWIQAGQRPCRQIVVTGYHGLWEAHKDPSLKTVLNAADLWVPDGIAPVWIARLKGHRHAQRIPGADLMQRFMQRADRNGYSSYFYGDTEEVLEALRARLETDFPGHRVAGMFSPPFGVTAPEVMDEHIRAINAARPDVLWVGLGLPKQDRWIRRHIDRLDVPVALGVGAAFGFLSGHVKRAPDWVGRFGCEWAWRLAAEPRKCWRRSLVEGPKFIGKVLLELTGVKRYD